MIGGATIVNAEEYQITTLQLAFLDRCRVTQVVHLIGGTWHLDFHQIFIGVINQATTVETRIW
ncbi:hypothetical protein D3C73_1430760 [compost metagenome]